MSQRYIHISGRRLASTIALLNKTPHATSDATTIPVALIEEGAITGNVLKFFKKTA
jgi:hypothetical protein